MGNIWAIQHHKWLEAGCVPALVFLSLFFTCVFNHIVWDLKQGVYLKYSINVSLMAINNMNEWMTYTTWGLRPRPSRGISWKHPLSTVVPSWCTRSLITSSWSTILMRCHAFYINLGKTGILLQTTPNSTAHLRSISMVKQSWRQWIEDFKCPGSVISSDGTLDKEIIVRICNVSRALGRLQVQVLNQHNIFPSQHSWRYTRPWSSQVSCNGCETWALYNIPETAGTVRYVLTEISSGHSLAGSSHQLGGLA